MGSYEPHRFFNKLLLAPVTLVHPAFQGAEEQNFPTSFRSLLLAPMC